MFAKRSSCALALLAVLVAASVCWLGTSARNSLAVPAPPPEADFADKILAIHTDYADKTGAVLEKVQVRKIGTRAFLVGKAVDNGQAGANAYKGLTMWFSVDHIVQIIEFGSMDELKKFMQQMPPPQPSLTPAAKQ